MSDSSVKVIFRFRGEQQTADLSEWVFENDGKGLFLGPEKNNDRQFSFDGTLQPQTTQEQVYEDHTKSSIHSFMKGFNVTVFAYGQTASGKTFTMVGPEAVVEQLMKNPFSIPEPVQLVFGIIPRSIFTIFTSINEGVENGASYQIKCSYLEVYNETVQDILATPVVQNLKIREFPGQGMVVVGATEKFITTPKQVFECLATGQKNRAVAATGANSRSSRSHTVFLLILEQKLPEGVIKVSKLNLVDLAGSEKLAKAQTTGQQLEETKKINQSLTCLGMCIKALTSKKKQHIPYRDSKLTMILRESLGGNSKTLIVCTGSLRKENEEETVSSLRFAQRAKRIVNKATSNVKRSAAEMEALIENFKKEVALLRAKLKKVGMKVPVNKELQLQMGDVEEPEVGDLEFEEEDFSLKYHELEAKFRVFQEETDKETERLRIEVERTKSEGLEELHKQKSYFEEQERQFIGEKKELQSQKEKLVDEVQRIDQERLHNEDEVNQQKKEIDRLKGQIIQEAETNQKQLQELGVLKVSLEDSKAQTQELEQNKRDLNYIIQQKDYQTTSQASEITSQREQIDLLKQQMSEKQSQMLASIQEKDQLSFQNQQLNERNDNSDKQLEQLKEKLKELQNEKDLIAKEKNEDFLEYTEKMSQFKERNKQLVQDLQERQQDIVQLQQHLSTLKAEANSKEMLEQMEARVQSVKESYEKEKNILKIDNASLEKQISQLEQKLAVEIQELKVKHQSELRQLQSLSEKDLQKIQSQYTETKERLLTSEKEKESVMIQLKVLHESLEQVQILLQGKEAENKDFKQKVFNITHQSDKIIQELKIENEMVGKQLSLAKNQMASDISLISEELQKAKKNYELLDSSAKSLEQEISKLRKQLVQAEASSVKKSEEITVLQNEIGRLEKLNQHYTQQLKDNLQEIMQLKNQINEQQSMIGPEDTNTITKVVAISSNLFGQHILRKTKNSLMQKALEEAQRYLVNVAQQIYQEINNSPSQLKLLQMSDSPSQFKLQQNGQPPPPQKQEKQQEKQEEKLQEKQQEKLSFQDLKKRFSQSSTIPIQEIQQQYQQQQQKQEEKQQEKKEEKQQEKSEEKQQEKLSFQDLQKRFSQSQSGPSFAPKPQKFSK